MCLRNNCIFPDLLTYVQCDTTTKWITVVSTSYCREIQLVILGLLISSKHVVKGITDDRYSLRISLFDDCYLYHTIVIAWKWLTYLWEANLGTWVLHIFCLWYYNVYVRASCTNEKVGFTYVSIYCVRIDIVYSLNSPIIFPSGARS